MRYELDFFTDGAMEKDRRLPGSLFGELTVGRQVWDEAFFTQPIRYSN